MMHEDFYLGNLEHDSLEKIFFAGMMRVLVRKCQLDEVDVYLDKVVIKFPDSWSDRLESREWKQGRFIEHFKAELIDERMRTWEFHFPDYQDFIAEFMKQP